MKAWRAWGSLPDDREGAWISLIGRGSDILTQSTMCRDERAPAYFVRWTPAALEVQGDFENRTIELEDVRGHQYIVFDPPMVTKSPTSISSVAL